MDPITVSPQINLAQLLSKMDYASSEDKKLVEKAYYFAEKAHADQKRYSGEPYFVHLVATAKNLVDLRMDAQSIAAGLLHDSIEDMHVSPAVIAGEFGEDVLFLIEGVTKLGALKYRGAERHVESLRKLFVAMAQDIRVLIIKLTDRLHNMETLRFVPEQKQKRIALETLEIYAPLAHRLGIWKLARELEDLAFPFIYPEEYEKVRKILRDRSRENEVHLEKIVNNIKKALAREGLTKFKTDYRVKGLFSFFKKLQRKDWNTDVVYDISAIRIVLPTESECYKVLGIIHSNWRPLPGRIKDYIALPKPNGYRSIHTTIFTGDGSIVEVQIRTDEMHREAEYGIASHLAYKENIPLDKINKNLNWIQRLLPQRVKVSASDKHTNDSGKPKTAPDWIRRLADEYGDGSEADEFMDDLRSDFLTHRMFVFTPQGDVIDLPANSSPIDFAYAVHSDIGDHVAGAKVNGKLVSLDTSLVNGDTVEIITKESNRPNRKWLEYARTTVAKRHIRSALALSRDANDTRI